MSSNRVKYLNMYNKYKNYAKSLKDRIEHIDTNCSESFKLLRTLSDEVWWNNDNDKEIVRDFSRKNILSPKNEQEVWNLIRQSNENRLEFESILKMLNKLCEQQNKNRVKLHKIISEASKNFGKAISKVKSNRLEPILEIDEGGKRKKRRSGKRKCCNRRSRSRSRSSKKRSRSRRSSKKRGRSYDGAASWDSMLRRYMHSEGFNFVRKTGGHSIWIDENGITITVSSTPKKSQYENILREISRDIKRAREKL